MDDPLVGTQLGHFKIERVIAEGGMGVIYQASHTVIGRKAAIKILSQKYSSDRNMIKRLHREARAVNRIAHPNIVDVFDFGQTRDQREYLVMEYVAGESLAQIQEKYGRIPWTLTSAILAQILDALAAAHDLGIVHRDVKPENILVVPQSKGVLVKVLDFGIAKSVGLGPEGEKLTRAGSVMGTPEYISPEQIRGRDVDGRADLYAVGAILFEMIMGRRPFESDKVISLLLMHLREPVPSMDSVPPELGVPSFVPAVVNKAMAKDPAERFPDARTFARALGLETSGVAPGDGTRPLPGLMWERTGETDLSAPGVTAASPAPIATGPLHPDLGAMPTLTASGPYPPLARTSADFPGIPGTARRGLPLRWVMPAVLALLAGAGVIFYFALRPTPAPVVSAGPVASPDGGPSPIKDLPALAETVRRVLRMCLDCPLPDARAHCARGMGALHDADSLPILSGLLKKDSEQTVRSATASAIAELSDPSGVEPLREIRDQSPPVVRVWIDDALMRLGQNDGRAGLLDALKSQEPSVRYQAALLLGEANHEDAQPVLLEIVRVAATSNKQITIASLAALARLGHKDGAATLTKLLTEGDPVMMLGAAEALARLGSDQALSTLKGLLSSGSDLSRLSAARVLASVGDYSGMDHLATGLRSKDDAVRQLAAEGLGSISDKAVLSPLSGALEDSRWLVKAAAAESLARILAVMPAAMVRRSQDWVKAALANRDWTMRYAAVGVASQMDPEQAVNLLGWAFQDEDPRVRAAAVASMGELRSRGAVPFLARALTDQSEEVRRRAASALGRVGDNSARGALQAAARDSSHSVRALAAGALLALGDTAFLKDLKDALSSPNPARRRDAVIALGSWNNPESVTLLESRLADSSPAVRLAAAEELARRGDSKGIPELKRALAGASAGGEREQRALAALAALGQKPTAELTALATSKSPEARALAMEHAPVLGREGVALLAHGARDAAPQVRAASAGALGRLANSQPEALPLLRALSRDPSPTVRMRAQLGLSQASRAKLPTETQRVAPVAPPPVAPPPPPEPPPRGVDPKIAGVRPLFVDDRSPQQLYMFHSARATLAAAAGKYEAALSHLKAARQARDEAPLLYDFGFVYLKLGIQQMQRSPQDARKSLLLAQDYFNQYLRRAPAGKQAPKAKGGLADVARLLKRVR